jgi:hypothetical protein
MNHIYENDEAEFSLLEIAYRFRAIIPSVKSISIMSDEIGLSNHLRIGFYKSFQINKLIQINNIMMNDAIRIGQKFSQKMIIYCVVSELSEGNGLQLVFEKINIFEKNKTESVGRQSFTFDLGEHVTESLEKINIEPSGLYFTIPFNEIQKMLDMELDNTIKLLRHFDINCNKNDLISANKNISLKLKYRLDDLVSESTSQDQINKIHEIGGLIWKLNQRVDKMNTSQGSTAYNNRGWYKMTLRKIGIYI